MKNPLNIKIKEIGFNVIKTERGVTLDNGTKLKERCNYYSGLLFWTFIIVAFFTGSIIDNSIHSHDYTNEIDKQKSLELATCMQSYSELAKQLDKANDRLAICNKEQSDFQYALIKVVLSKAMNQTK